MNELFLHAAYGFLGGLLRGLIGVYKAQHAKKPKPFKPGYLVITVFIAACIGAIVAFTLVNDYRVSILAGYAGIDILESIHKIYKKEN